MKEFLARMKTNWLMIGDKSRYEFLKWLNVEVANNECITYNEETMYFPKNSEDGINKLKICQRCIIFEESPFNKESTSELMRNWIENSCGKPALIVIMDLPRKQSSTDLDKIGEDVNEAIKIYEHAGYNFCVAKTAADTFHLMNWHFKFYQPLIYNAKNKLQILNENIKYLIDDEYEEFIYQCEHGKGCLTDSAKANICSYNSVRNFINSTKCIWQCYNMAAERKIFSETGAINELIKIYDTFLKDLFQMAGCNINEENAYLKSELKTAFNQYMITNDTHYQATIYDINIKSDIEYTKLTETGNFYGIKTAYLKKFREFLETEAKMVIKKVLYEKYEHLKKAIN